MSGTGEYNKLVDRTKERYNIRELPGCFVVENNNGSVIVYRTNGGKGITICFNDQRGYGEGKEVDEIIDRYCK